MEPTLPQPIAHWNPTLDCWLASDDEAESLFSVPSVVFSETFPHSGMTRAGTAYALPTSVPLMDDSDTSSSLPTPNTMDHLPTRSDEALARAQELGGCSNLKDHPLIRG